jgi:hypothetical protein
MTNAKWPKWHFDNEGILVDENKEEIDLSVAYYDKPAGRLIQAAPELANALVALVERVERHHGQCSETIVARDALKRAGKPS